MIHSSCSVLYYLNDFFFTFSNKKYYTCDLNSLKLLWELIDQLKPAKAASQVKISQVAHKAGKSRAEPSLAELRQHYSHSLSLNRPDCILARMLEPQLTLRVGLLMEEEG